jgi:hypothetical protein
MALCRATDVTHTQLACSVHCDSAESLELRILEALAGVYPRTLNGAQLAKLCGHFKLKSKVSNWQRGAHMGLLLLCTLQLHLLSCLPAWHHLGRAFFWYLQQRGCGA